MSRPRPGPAPARARTSPRASPRRPPAPRTPSTYIEWSYAKDNNLPIAQLDSGNGPVELSGDAVGKAVSEAKVKGSGNDLSLDLKYSGTKAGAYPALLVTYEIVVQQGLGGRQDGNRQGLPDVLLLR